jgi:hypothetical protein
MLIHDNNPKETFPLSAQLGGKVKQQRACKGLYEICLTGCGGVVRGVNRFTNLSTPLTACKPSLAHVFNNLAKVSLTTY